MELKTKDKRLTPYSPFEVTADTYYGTCGDGAAHMLDQALPTPFLKLLQDPCLPTFSLSSLPQSIIEDIQQITSPKIKAIRQPHAWQNGASMDCDDSRVAWQGSDPNGFSRACSMPQMRGRSGPSHEAWRPKPAFSMPLDNLEIECPSPDNVQLIDAPNSFSGNIPRIPGSPLTCKRRKSLQLPAMVSEEEEPTLEWMSEIVAKCGPQSRSPSPHCFQCGTQVTPQWRAGPLGPRTLCNACGVKFKKLNQ